MRARTGRVFGQTQHHPATTHAERTLSTILSALILVCFWLSATVAAQSEIGKEEATRILKDNYSISTLKFAENGVPQMIIGRLSSPLTDGSAEDAADVVYQFLDSTKAAFGLKNPREELRHVKGGEVFARGVRVLQFDQEFHGAPVRGNGMTARFDRHGVLMTIMCHLCPWIDISTEPTLTGEEALDIARRMAGIPESDLPAMFDTLPKAWTINLNTCRITGPFIYTDAPEPHLAWDVLLGMSGHYYIDAHTGEKLGWGSGVIE